MREVLLLSVGVISGMLGPVGGVMSLISFPALLLLGTPALSANAANTIAVASPGAVGATIGYRDKLRQQPARLLAAFMACGALGGVLGAIIVLHMGEQAFTTAVPILLIGGSVLIMGQPWLLRQLARWRQRPAYSQQYLFHPLVAVLLTFPVAIYAGYFGVAAGVVFVGVYLAVLTADLHTANAVKSLVGAVPNLVASLVFVWVWRRGELPLDWSDIICLGVGSLAGGIFGVRIAQRLPLTTLRLIISCCGVAAAIVALR